MPRPLYDSEYLYGLHDPGGEDIMLGQGAPGWVFFTEAVGYNPADTSGRNYSDWSSRGLGVMVRLNAGYDGVGTIPYEREYANFATRCANFVRSSQGARIWVIGNEMNHPIEWPGAQWNWNRFPPAPVSEDKRGETITPTRYVNCYRKVRTAIKAVPGHADDQVLIGAVGPWNTLTKYDGNTTGDWVKYLSDILTRLGPENCDGITLHAYTHGADPALVRSDERMKASEFSNRRWHFRVYQDFLAAIPPNMRHLPVYITEANQGDDAWRDDNSGWVRAAYGEIADWNSKAVTSSSNAPAVIRSLILYRYPRVGQDRWYITGKQGVIEDFKAALTAGYRWTTTGGAPTGDDSLAEWWQDYDALDARFKTLAPDISTATKLADKLKADETDLLKLAAPMEAAIQARVRLDAINAQVRQLEAQVAAVTAPTAPEVPMPPIQDLTSSLPQHPTAVWSTRELGVISRIVIHHTVTRPDTSPQRIAEVHVSQNKPGIAYHYLVAGDGAISATQPLTALVIQLNSSANQATNADSVALALAGNFSADKDVEPNVVQRKAAAQLIAWLMNTLGLGIAPEQTVFGRNELGENVGSPGSQWLDGVRYKDKLLADVELALAPENSAQIEIERLRAQVALLEERVDQLEPIAAQVPGLQQQVAALQASVNAKQAEITRLEAYIKTHSFGPSGGVGMVAKPAIVDIVNDLPKHATKKYSNRTQRLTSLVVHHTTGRSTLTPYDIARYHVESRDWPGVGYHYLIGADGTINLCNKHETYSFHAGTANGYSLGISLIGEFMNGNLPTPAQFESTCRLIAWLMQELGINDVQKVVGHKEVPDAQTACPGDQWLTGATWKKTLHERVQAIRTAKPNSFYLLFWDHGDAWAEADYRNAFNYVAKFRPTHGFNVAEAMQARRVLIVGGVAGVSGDDEAKLRASGCEVQRLAGTSEAETKAQLDALAAANTPWPGAPPLDQLAGGAGAMALDEPLRDAWYIRPEWVATHVGPDLPPEPEDYARVRVEEDFFPEMVSATNRRRLVADGRPAGRIVTAGDSQPQVEPIG